MPVICWKMKNTQTTTRARRTPGSSSAALRLAVAALDLFDGLGGSLDVLVADVLDPEDAQGGAELIVLAVPQQPARRLRHRGAQGQAEQGRHRAEAEDQPPADRGGGIGPDPKMSQATR